MLFQCRSDRKVDNQAARMGERGADMEKSDEIGVVGGPR